MITVMMAHDWSRSDDAETPVQWGGYSWGPQLFPRPEHFLKSVDALGLNTTLNLHLNPILPPPTTKASSWAKFLHQLGLPANHNASIPGPNSAPYTGTVDEELLTSKTFGEAYLHLLDDMGTK